MYLSMLLLSFFLFCCDDFLRSDRQILFSKKGPWMRRPSYLMWNEAEDTYKEHSPVPSKSHKASPNLFKKTPAHHTSRASSIPSSVPASVSPMIKRRPKVRKSTLLLKIISKRDLNTNPVDTQDKSRESTSNLNQLDAPSSGQTTASGSGYNSDNEEEDSQLIQISDHTQQFKRNKINHNTDDENKTNNDIDDDNVEDKDNNNDFNCELCGRVVPKANTSLVDSLTNPDEKIRICEVCLYESDSEEDTTADESGFLEAMDSRPQSIIASQNGSPDRSGNVEQMNEVKSRTRAMSQSISNLLNHLDNTGDIKQELMKLQIDMKQLFND